MGAATSVDQLQIDIQTQSTKANDALDRLVLKLDKLSASLGKIDGSKITGLANGVSKLGSAMQGMNNIKTADFTRLASNLQKLGNINVSALNSSASSISLISKSFNGLGTVSQNAQQVGEMSKNIAKLGNKNVQQAIANMPNLATAMKNFMQTLSTAPNVNQNIIQMTNALAKLTAQGSKVGTLSNSLFGGLNRTDSAMTRATKKTFSLSSAIGRFYQTYYLAIRGIKKLWESIEGTADYIEAYNYYNVAFGKIASEWKQDFKKFGYENAEAYAESFTNRMNSTLGKLSGVQINTETGMLSDTGMKNLGLNIKEITQYASQLASVTNSVGQTGEISLAVANSFTKLAGDISSLFNLDYSTVATNLQSGLIGQSRALYKYGIDITNATLQTYAYKLGLSKAVSEMTQAEKMQLRMIAILDQSRVSWGDQANTLNSVSNMVRQLKNNASELGTVFGQLFVPVLQKVLPVINGVSIALKRLVTDIAGFLGIEIDLSSFGQGYTDIEDGFGDIEDGLNGVTNAANKATKGLQGFDELSNLTSSASSSGASGAGGGIDLTDEIIKATEEYEKVWNAAYDKMESKAQKFADKIEGVLKPVKKLFKDIAIGDWFAVGEDTSNLVSGIFDFFSDAIESVDWHRVGTKIGDFVAGIEWMKVLKSVGRFIWEAINAGLETFEGLFETAPIEMALASLVPMPKLLKTITKSSIVTGIKKLATNLKLTTTALGGNKTSIVELTKQYPKFGNAVNVARKSFANFRFGIENGNFLTGVSEGFKAIQSNMSGLTKGLVGVGAGFAELLIVKDSIRDIITGTGNLSANITELGLAIAGAGAAFSLVLGFPAGLIATGIVGLTGAFGGIVSAMNEINAERIGKSIRDAFENPGGIPLDDVVNKVVGSIQNIGNSFSIINEKSQELDSTKANIEETWLEIEKIEKSMDAGVLSVEEGSQELSKLFGQLADTASQKFDLLETTLLSAYGESGALAQTMNRLGITTTSTTNTILQLNDKVEQRIKEITTTLSTLDPTNPKYAELRSELAELVGTTDEVSKAISDFEFKVGSTNVDYSGLLADTELDTSKVTNYLTGITDAISTANTDIETGILGIKTSLTEELNAALAIGDIVKAEEIQAQLDVLPQALSLLQDDIKIQGTTVADNMQLHFIGRINEVIAQAEKDWADMKWYEKLFYANNFDAYAKETVNKYKSDYIDPLSQEIENQYAELGINGAGWADEAAEEMMNGLFNSTVYHSDSIAGRLSVELNNDYKGVVNDSTAGLSELMEEKGKDTVEGYNEGISKNASSSEKETKSWIQKVVDKVKEVLDSHSPSRVLKSIGKDTVTGYNEGIEGSESKSISTVEQLIKNIRNKFSTLDLSSIGKNIINGLTEGITSKAKSLYEQITTIANNIANKMKKALDIHSPSRVMFDIGGFTMEGFDKGLEQWKAPILDSIRNFGSKFKDVSMDWLNVDYEYPALQQPISTDYLPHKGYWQNADTGVDNAETNALLRELISAVKSGNVITIDGREVGRTVQKENREYYLRTGKGLLEV